MLGSSLGSYQALQTYRITTFSLLHRCAASSLPLLQPFWLSHCTSRAFCGVTPPLRSAAMCPGAARTAAGDIQPAKGREVLQFWLGDDFRQAKTHSFPQKEIMKKWFKGGPALDQEMTDKFGSLLKEAASTGLADWSHGYNGLAAVLLLDQFSRNIYRGTSAMYDLDDVAVDRARSLLENGDAAAFPLSHRIWLLYPFMHSENPQNQEMSVSLAKQMLEEGKPLKDAEDLQKYLQVAVGFAESHKQVVDRWGRYPHRNELLGRSNTAEEEEAMSTGSIPHF